MQMPFLKPSLTLFHFLLLITAVLDLQAEENKNVLHTQSVEERLEQLTQEIERLKSRENEQNESPEILMKSDILGEDPALITNYIPSPATSRPIIEVHGIVRADGVVMDRIPQFGNIIQPATIQVPLDKQRERKHGQTIVDGRWSRFSVDASHEACNVKIFGIVEADFESLDGTSLFLNSRHCRLRHAYLRMDFSKGWYFQVGQTWDLMTTLEIAAPMALNITDFQGPAGATYGRQPLLKVGYVQKNVHCRGEYEFMIGVSQQSVWIGTDFSPKIALFPDQGEAQIYPFLGTAFTWRNWDPFQLDVRAGVSQNRYVLTDSGKIKETLSWIGKVSVQSKIWYPTFYASYTYMDGMNRKALLVFPDSVLTGSNRMKNVKGHGLYTGTWFDICENLTVNTTFGWAWASSIDDSSFTGDAYCQYRSGQIDIFHNFWEFYSIALGFKRWDVKNFKGDRGHVNLYQATLFYFF